MMEEHLYDLLLKHTHLIRLCEKVYILPIRSSPDLGSFLGYLDKLAAKPMSNISFGWVVHYLRAFLMIDCFAALYYGTFSYWTFI